MKQLSKWLMAATLFCGLFTLASCDEESDNPVDNSGNGETVVVDDDTWNREQILYHIKSDAQVLADNMNPEMFNLTNGVYSQLMTLMARDRNYMQNMKQIFSMMAANSALKNIKPVTKGSELAKMGYQMYIPVDFQTFGVQVVFDENGSSRLFPCEGLEFIFPATIDGFSTTLYKVAIRAGNSWKETIAPAQLKNLKGIACVYRVPETITMTLSGLFDNKVLTLSSSSFDIGETDISGQTSTSLKGVGYGLPDVESTLDFKFSNVEEGKLKMYCSYVNNGLNVMNLGAMLTLPQTGKLTELLSKIDFNGIYVDFDMRILNDLNLYGSISDIAQYSKAFMNIIGSYHNNVSSVDLSDNVDKLNLYSQVYIISQNAQSPLLLRLMTEWKDNKMLLMPGIWSYERFELIPFDAYMEQSDVEIVNKTLEAILSPMGTNTVYGMQVFSRIMQMLPLNSAEWGL